MTTESLVPLQNSFANGTLEAELRQIAIDLYTATLAQQEREIATYGAPYLGDQTVIQRFVQQDGLSILSSDPSVIGYLFRAWHYRNPRRGLAFAELYLTTLFGNTFTIEQLWQNINQTYPTSLASQSDMAIYGYNPANYWLTSRIRVEVNTNTPVPLRIPLSLRTTLPARLLLDFRVRGNMAETMGAAGWMGAASVVRTISHAAPGVPMGIEGTAISPMYMGAANVAYMAGQLPAAPYTLVLNGTWYLDGSKKLNGFS